MSRRFRQGTNAPRSGIRSVRDPQHWMMPPWARSADVHDVVGHFMRFALADDATDLEHLAYHEAYVAALEAAREHSPSLRSAFAERWYQDLHDALLRCLERYRLRCEENENRSDPDQLPNSTFAEGSP